jgi:hypothetical protein
MRRTLQRIIAFVRGDINTAEKLGEYSEWGPVPWIADSARDEKLATYAVEVTFRGATHASAAVESIEKKASSLLTIVLALIPVGFAVTAFSTRRIQAVNCRSDFLARALLCR